ncbi:hypothetical protein N0V83_010369 [Neocucurbitaria cava]|uniref:C2H2-type domain-containing protein n=1 Tax=Neocucurbitaria cava TaxID=798079 RepID=A0A9W8XY83_9PLEO|nr:hypothetical protein N0V83_010369 [Neocucurbitaria cava]
MAIQERKQTNIFLTLKVLQFVNHLRRRVKPRILKASIDPVDLGSTECSLGLRSVGSGSSSRVRSQNAKQSGRLAQRVCKTCRSGPKRFRPSLKVQTTGSDVSAIPNASGDEVQHMLSSVDDKLSPAETAFSSIAGRDKLFLKHSNAPIIEGCSLNQIVQLLVTVQDAIDVLGDCRSQYGDDWLRLQGHDVGLNIDENFIANYEHMLLRLRAELTEALARKALEELLNGGHDKRQRKMLNWFTEFAEKPRPLSTSFPWTIKPSLAVLWGVCWMFYDNSSGEQAAKGGNDRVRQARVLQHIQWNAPASSDYLDLGRALIGTQPQHTTPQQTTDNAGMGLENNMFQARNTDTWESDLSFRLPSLEISQAGANGPSMRADGAAPQPDLDSSEQDGEDDGSLRKNHSYKRAEEPPRNEDGKMYCRHHECAGLFFDRKCEWSKHMDKHDRPYKCTVKGCEKLQGFTYSGGLLRHEREVHKMHGGTKKSLYCPFPDCKRSSGAGFTRKENLAEHVRRVHRRTSMSADMHGLVIRRDTMEGSPIVESRGASESPYTRNMDYQDEDDMTLKRKRGSNSGFSDRGNDEMRAEIKRLRKNNEEKDSRLRQLERAVMDLQQGRR